MAAPNFMPSAQARGIPVTAIQNDVKLDVSLSMTAQGKHLRIEYAVTNNTKHKILLWDLVVEAEGGKLVARPSAISTVNGDQPGSVLFVRGRVQPQSRVNVEYVPGLREVGAGQRATGSAEVKLPLESWLAYGAVQPLETVPKTAVFELQYFPGEHATQVVQLADGSSLRKPVQPWSDVLKLRSAPIPIPSK